MNRLKQECLQLLRPCWRWVLVVAAGASLSISGMTLIYLTLFVQTLCKLHYTAGLAHMDLTSSNIMMSHKQPCQLLYLVRYG